VRKTGKKIPIKQKGRGGEERGLKRARSVIKRHGRVRICFRKNYFLRIRHRAPWNTWKKGGSNRVGGGGTEHRSGPVPNKNSEKGNERESMVKGVVATDLEGSRPETNSKKWKKR